MELHTEFLFDFGGEPMGILRWLCSVKECHVSTHDGLSCEEERELLLCHIKFHR